MGRDVYLDTAYTLGHLPDADFVEIVHAHGAEKVLFGSDGPWTDAGAEIAWLRGLPLASGRHRGGSGRKRGAAARRMSRLEEPVGTDFAYPLPVARRTRGADARQPGAGR